MNISEAEEIEMRVFGAPNAVVVLGEGQERGGLDQQNVEQANANNSGNHTTDVLSQLANDAFEQSNSNCHLASTVS